MRKPFLIETMTDDELDAHALSVGWRVVARVPNDPALLTADHAKALFAGDVEGALRDFYASVSHPAPLPEPAVKTA